MGCKGVYITRICLHEGKGYSIGFSSHFFRMLEFIFAVAIIDLVHNVEAIFHITKLLTASGNLFCNVSGHYSLI